MLHDELPLVWLCHPLLLMVADVAAVVDRCAELGWEDTCEEGCGCLFRQ